MRDSIIFFALILKLILISGCFYEVRDNYTNVIIEREGVYTFDNGLKLEIVVDDDEFVKYFLQDEANNILVQPIYNISTYQKWVALWDGERLWFDSSDIGGDVWVKQKNGKYQNIPFTELGELSNDMPEAMYQDILKVVNAYPDLYNWKPKDCVPSTCPDK